MNQKSAILVLVLMAAGVTCLLGSCEEECTPCDAGSTDPALKLLGAWEVVEAYMNGTPDPSSVGMVMDFRKDDKVIVYTDTLKWLATEDIILMMEEDMSMIIPFEYFFDDDTLDMTGNIMLNTMHLRLIELIMPVHYYGGDAQSLFDLPGRAAVTADRE